MQRLASLVERLTLLAGLAVMVICVGLAVPLGLAIHAQDQPTVDWYTLRFVVALVAGLALAVLCQLSHIYLEVWADRDRAEARAQAQVVLEQKLDGAYRFFDLAKLHGADMDDSVLPQPFVLGAGAAGLKIIESRRPLDYPVVQQDPELRMAEQSIERLDAALADLRARRDARHAQRLEELEARAQEIKRACAPMSMADIDTLAERDELRYGTGEGPACGNPSCDGSCGTCQEYTEYLNGPTDPRD